MFKSLLTFLAVIGVPATIVVVIVKYGLSALWVVFQDTRTNIAALFGLLVPSNVIVELCIHNDRPVDGIQVTELRVLLNPNGTTGDIPQVEQTNVLEASHLKNDQSIVVEEGTSTDDSQIGEKGAQTVQARHSEEQQVISDHSQLGEAKGAEDVLIGGIAFVPNE